MSYQAIPQIEVSPGQLVEHLVQYDGPPDQFLLQLLAVQCHVGQAEHGAILRQSAGRGDGPGNLEVLTLYPPMESGATAPSWLAQAVELAPIVLNGKKPKTAPLHMPGELYGVTASRHLILLPIWGKANVRGVAGFVVPFGDPQQVEQSRKQLELTIGLLSLYELRLTLQRRKTDLKRMRQSCEVLNSVNEQTRFKAAAMALCNQIATAWKAERVAFGLLRGRYVKLQALSHTEKFTRKMELVQTLESAMEESLDQDVEVIYPSAPASTTINRAAKELSGTGGGTIALTLPMRRNGEPVGALTIERATDKPFELEEVESLRLACDLCTARLAEMGEHDQWFGARLALGTKRTVSVLVGPQYTWAKVAGILATALLCFSIFVEGTYRVEAPFIVETQQLQTIAAPFPGILAKTTILPGDPVEAGKTVLAELDTRDLVVSKIKAEAERDNARIEADNLRSQNKHAEAAAAEKQAEIAETEIRYLTQKIADSVLTSPIDGQVLTGDFTKQLGTPLEQGQKLFEVAPDDLRAELTVQEGDIADLKPGLKGRMASVAHPGDFVEFEVDRIDPVADVVDQQNVFRVRVTLINPPDWLRPGMEGLGKVDVEPRRYIKIWSRDLVNWVKMKLWLGDIDHGTQPESSK